jgi:hypothetical protein
MCVTVALAGCSGHGSGSNDRSVPTIQIGYPYGSASNPLDIGPAPAGVVPTVPEEQGRADIDRAAASWLDGLNVHGDLVRFGFGEARGRAYDSQGDDHAFRHRRPAWIAVFRFATAGMRASTCLAAPSVKAGYRLVQQRQRPIALLVVLDDAETGYVATWSNVGSTCPQPVRFATAGEGRVSGRFLAVGGPVGAGADPQRGRVILRNARHRVAVAVGPNGRFTMIAPIGRYRLLGFTPQFTVNGHQAQCDATRPAVVRSQAQTRSNVYCQRR